MTRRVAIHVVFVHYGNIDASAAFARWLASRWPATIVNAVDTARNDLGSINDAFEFSGYAVGMSRVLEQIDNNDPVRIIFCNDTVFNAHDRYYVQALLNAFHDCAETAPAILGCAESVPPGTPVDHRVYFPTFAYAIQGTRVQLERVQLFDQVFGSIEQWRIFWETLPELYRRSVDLWLQPTSALKGWYQALPGHPLPERTLFRKRFAIYQEHTLVDRVCQQGFRVVDMCAPSRRLRAGRLWDRIVGNLNKWSYRIQHALKLR